MRARLWRLKDNPCKNSAYARVRIPRRGLVCLISDDVEHVGATAERLLAISDSPFFGYYNRVVQRSIFPSNGIGMADVEQNMRLESRAPSRYLNCTFPLDSTPVLRSVRQVIKRTKPRGLQILDKVRQDSFAAGVMNQARLAQAVVASSEILKMGRRFRDRHIGTWRTRDIWRQDVSGVCYLKPYGYAASDSRTRYHT